MNNLGPRIRGFAACLAILALVVAFPATLIAIGLAPWDADFAEFRRMLTRPDDGSLALAAFAAVGWFAWAVLTGSVLLAVVAEVRRVPAPSLPGLALPQEFAARLVSVAALLFVAGPAIAVTAPSLPAHSAPATFSATPPSSPLQVAPSEAHSEPKAVPVADSQTAEYTVTRGDSLWRIAERLLGDGARFKELVELNADVLDGRPDFITPGTVLRVPAVEPAPSTDSVVVQPGDTLSEIAEEELGDSARYPEIFHASRATEQPGGAHLEDPDLIQPGWRLTIPQDAAPPSNQHGDTAHPQTPPVVETPPAEAPSPQAERSQSPAAAEPVGDGDDTEDVATQGAPDWLLPGVAGGGLLAGAVLMAVRAHRRTQLRYRRPGQVLAPNPPELAKIEKTSGALGRRAIVDIEGLDAALEDLAGRARRDGTPVPSLTSLSLAHGVATCSFAQAVTLTDPWRGEDRVWAVDLTAVHGDDDVLSPYPMLVSVGRDDAGALWLVNLEPLRSVALTGDPEYAVALARHFAAELALNPWSLLVQTATFGLGEELGDLDTLRLRSYGPDDAAAAALLEEIETASHRTGDEPDPWRVVMTSDPRMASRIKTAAATAKGRLGAAAVTFGSPPPGGATLFELSASGRLTIPTLGIDVAAAGLTAEEAALCAAIVDVTRVTPTTDVPVFSQAADGWRSVADQAGALRPEFTEPRPSEDAGPAALLPGPTDSYVEVAAAVEDDVNELAPIATEDATHRFDDVDPTLPNDVAEWFNEDSRLPRLTLLGPVRVTAHGKLVDQIVKRRPYYSEILAFLALHPEGVTSRAIAEAFHIGLPRARTDVGHVREWLGVDPRTGRLHIPRQGDDPNEEWHGYHVDGLLVDVDLFRRLRARGQARGAEGISDLRQALRLVRGEPFDQLRDQGWSWLLDGERLQDLIPSAIADTAHIVVMDALHHGDLEVARECAEIACQAAPYDEVSRLDLVKVLEAQGHGEAAERMLDQDVFNRRDDDEGPIDLPARTKDVVSQNGWGARRAQQPRRTPPRPRAS